MQWLNLAAEAWHDTSYRWQRKISREQLPPIKTSFFASVLENIFMIYALRWLYNDLQRFRKALQRFTTVYSGSHRFTYHGKKNKCYFFDWGCEPLWTVVNRCELIEIYSLAHVNRKKLNIPKQQKLFSTFYPNVSSKTISWNNSCQ